MRRGAAAWWRYGGGGGGGGGGEEWVEGGKVVQHAPLPQAWHFLQVPGSDPLQPSRYLDPPSYEQPSHAAHDPRLAVWVASSFPPQPTT